jgi:hypothetical protein
MDPFAQSLAAKKPQTQAINPFAKALAETERPLSENLSSSGNNNSVFSEALARTGGQFPSGNDASFGDNFSQQNQMFDPEKQRLEMEQKQKKEALRKKLHDQINHVNSENVFDAQQNRVAKELEKTRQELKMLAKELAHLRMDIDIEVTKVIVNPGRQGTYYISFFQQLRQFIMLLRQKVRSARTWLQQSQAKKKKSKQPGMEVAGKKHEQTKTVFDTMHHERASSYSGS